MGGEKPDTCWGGRIILAANGERVEREDRNRILLRGRRNIGGKWEEVEGRGIEYST